MGYINHSVLLHMLRVKELVPSQPLDTKGDLYFFKTI